jgi:hypothetical protein
MLLDHAYIGVALRKESPLFLLFLQEIISGGWLLRRGNPGVSADA